jgi:hypothetical protein
MVDVLMGMMVVPIRTSKTHYIDSQYSDKTAPSGRELYHLQFSLQVASPETYGYTLVYMDSAKKANWTPGVCGVSFMYKLYSVGARTEYYGTPT